MAIVLQCLHTSATLNNKASIILNEDSNAESEGTIGSTFGELLQSLGIEVDFACDGLEAVEKAKAYRYDAMLMDIQMPELDGIEAMAILKQELAENSRVLNFSMLQYK